MEFIPLYAILLFIIAILWIFCWAASHYDPKSFHPFQTGQGMVSPTPIDLGMDGTPEPGTIEYALFTAKWNESSNRKMAKAYPNNADSFLGAANAFEIMKGVIQEVIDARDL